MRCVHRSPRPLVCAWRASKRFEPRVLASATETLPPTKPVVFVAGATGRTGIRVCRELLAAGYTVRAGVRDVSKAEAIFAGRASPAGVGYTGAKEAPPAALVGLIPVACDGERSSTSRFLASRRASHSRPRPSDKTRNTAGRNWRRRGCCVVLGRPRERGAQPLPPARHRRRRRHFAGGGCQSVGHGAALPHGVLAGHRQIRVARVRAQPVLERAGAQSAGGGCAAAQRHRVHHHPAGVSSLPPFFLPLECCL